MRIISGSAKGRSLLGPGKKTGPATIRPTSDRAREALFNIIGHERIQDAWVLDLFAGTGALGLESLSRGAAQALFVDKNQPAVNLIHQNAERCSLHDSCHIVKRDLSKSLRFLRNNLTRNNTSSPEKTAFDLVFLDPPYDRFKADFFLGQLQKYALIQPHSLVIFEDRSNNVLPESVMDLRLADQRQYGDTGFWFYSCQ